MPIILKNKNINLIVDNPLENYSNSRFDWSGKLVSLEYNGIELLSTELLNQDSTEDLHFGKGLYNEFGTTQPLGFYDCHIDERFHKIGIGSLQKTNSSYNNQNTSDVIPADFKVIPTKNEIEISVRSSIINGYGYELRKTITLLENGFSITYHLTNTGSKILETDEYNHNFLLFGSNPIGKGYSLILPTTIKLSELTELVNKEKSMVIEKNKIHFQKTPTQPFFISTELKNACVDAHWILENTDLNIGISETCDLKTRKIHLWGSEHVISPELFIALKINPSETKAWTRSYSLYKLQ